MKKGNLSGPTTKSSLASVLKELQDKYERIVKQNALDYYNEETTKKDFIHPLFSALGWDFQNKYTPNEVSAEESVSKKRVDYGFRINGILKFYLETKPLKDNLDHSQAAQQAISYAYHKGCTWAVLSNYYELVIYNAEAIEKNPEKNLCKSFPYSQYLDRIDELWLLSRESFEQNALDFEAEKWGKKFRKISIDYQLCSDFSKFRSVLSHNISSNNSPIEEEVIDECVQRILDRFIFIRSCEDRQLEEISLLHALRIWQADNTLGLWPKIAEIFAKYDKNYNSKLFHAHSVDQLVIHDRVIGKIIDELYRSSNKYMNYDFSAIEADVLGSIYEQYLGYILSKRATKSMAARVGSHKKEQGIYYTPTFIVDYMVNNTVGIALRSKGFHSEKIKVLDLSCGSGSFLIKAFDYVLAHTMENVDSKQFKWSVDSSGEIYATKENILVNNIFGVDLDSKAVEIAQLNLLLKIAEKRHRLPLLHRNVKCGNSLIEDANYPSGRFFDWEKEFPSVIAQEGGFDVILGNPPYVAWNKIVPVDKNYFVKKEFLGLEYSCRPNHKDSQPNYYLFFIVRAAKLLKNKGTLAFILPQEWLYHEYAQAFRDFILENFANVKIVQFRPDFKVFKSASETVGTNSLILFLRKEGNRQVLHYFVDSMNLISIKEILASNKLPVPTKVPFAKLTNKEWAFPSNAALRIKAAIKGISNLAYLSDIRYFKVIGGFQPPVKLSESYKLSAEEYQKIPVQERDVVYSLVFEANEIKPYVIASLNQFYWVVANDVKNETTFREEYPSLYGLLRNRITHRRKNWWCFPNPRNLELIKNNKEKILCPRIADRPSFALDSGRSVFKGTNTGIIVKDSSKLSIAYVLGILNSKLSDYWYSNFGFEYHGGKSKKYEPAKVEKHSIPILIADKIEQTRIEKKALRLVQMHSALIQMGKKNIDRRERLVDDIDNEQLELDKDICLLYGIEYQEIVNT